MDLQDAKSLLDLIDDPNERVRTAAVRALVRLPLTIEAWRAVQTAVLRLLREDGPPTWRREVITSAAFVPFKSMRSELASLLRAPSPDTRDAAALALALARDRRALEPILAQLGTEDSTTRLAAAEALARLDPLELLGAADRLREHLRSEPEVEVRFWLALALARSSRLLALAELLDDPPNELFDKLPDLTELEGRVRDNGPAAAGVTEEFGELAELRGPNWGAGFADAILAGWRAAARQAQTDGQQPPPRELHRSRPDVTRLLATYRRLVERAERKEVIEQLAWRAAQGGARWLLTGLAPKLAAGDATTRTLACRLIEQAARYLDLVGAPVFGTPQPARRDLPLLADGAAGPEPADKLHKPTAVEIKEAMLPGTALNPEVRRLKAEVVEAASGHPRRHAFAPGSKHVVMVHIGPGDAGPLAIKTTFPDHEVRRDDTGGAVLQVAFVSEGPKGIAVQTQPLPLPPTGPTKQVQFHLVVASNATDVRCSLLVFQGTRLLQSAELSGPVATRDHPVDRRQLRLLRTADVVPMPTADSSRPQFDASLSFHVGTVEEALLVYPKPHHLLIHIQGLNEFHEQIVSLLRDAVDDEAHDGMAPGSPQQEAALRSLARHGNTFYQRLQPELKGTAIRTNVQLTTFEDDVVPLEFVYDFGYPTTNARLSRHWRQALASGRCSCRPRDGTARVVCPLGFWGIRLTIERQLARGESRSTEASLAGQPRPGHDTLAALNRVLFAASARVDGERKGERKRTTDLLRHRLGEGCRVATSWRGWRRAVAEHRPGLLLSLPHAGTADDGLPVLEIGRSSKLEVGAVTGDYVVAAGSAVGPVVMLLGCGTAVADVPWQSAAGAFRRRGASVVVGTLAETLGRQTAPMARLLADILWGSDPISEPTVGAIMRTVRRRLLAEGSTLGMSLVAFGHADWQLPQRER